MTRNVDQLRSIQTFEELIPFLEDDLDWPFPHGSQDYEFDDLTFEYTPDELGLEDEYAAKIKRIHQLRPLVSGQPWGIFFVEFENKKLPIVVLRRILSHLVLKQRKSANPADRARWNAGDLLFISAFAEEGTLQREIAFAHFHQDPGDQPTLRVLGWDGGDTPLKLEHVSLILKHRLSWPKNPNDHAAWRKQWAGAFRYSIGQQIRTADLLARELARVARNIRDAAMSLMKVESSRGPLRRMHEAFRTSLIHDLTQEGFADTYAQTITYGLLTAAISRTDRSGGADGTFVLAEDIHNMVPITNPFLKEMLESFLKVGGRGTSHQPGLDFDELGVQEVVEMLRSSEIDLPAVLEDFGNRNPGEDPVIRFYEDFLKAYNKDLKIKRGVFYTPQPVVSYIVRSLHELLQNTFDLPEGLASTITWREMAAQMTSSGKPFAIPDGTSPDSHFVVILDPATGTATFLVEIIDVIFRTLTKKWKAARLTSAAQREEWNRYVPAHLLPRVFGYELLMAPYAIAHMKIGLKLHETGYTFATQERVRVYLTNALEPPTDSSKQLTISQLFPALSHEANAVNTVKKNSRFTVVVGNPPYSKISSNLTPEMRAIVERYRYFRGAKIKEKGALQFEINLQDDYVKFLRMCEQTLIRAGCGLLGMITNNGYLSTPTLRGMRDSLCETFESIRIVDLHGHIAKGETDADGNQEENVFDIVQGVGIILAIRVSIENKQSRVLHADFYGTRESKYSSLNSSTETSTDFAILVPTEPFLLFVPTSAAMEVEWRLFAGLTDIFSTNSAGIITARDGLVISDDKTALSKRIDRFRKATETDEEVYDEFNFSFSKRFNLREAQSELRSIKELESYIQPILHRPFDKRYLFFHPSVVWSMSRPMASLMMKQDNIALLATRQVTGQAFNHAFVSRQMIEIKACSHDRNTQIFPLYLSESSNKLSFVSQESNLSTAVHARFSEALRNGAGVPEGDDAVRDREVFPSEMFAYIYAILHGMGYRTRYFELLRSEFPRIPVIENRPLFQKLVILGQRLIDLHLLEEPSLNALEIDYRGPAEPTVSKLSHSLESIWINKERSAGFDKVPKLVWEFRIGGYQVCEKWLKDRKGRTLSTEDMIHYRKIISAISETLLLMSKIDVVIEEHGGWPGAFA